MNETCENDIATVIYDNPCYLDKSYYNALDAGYMLFDVINYNATENRIAIICPIPFMSDQSSCFAIAKSGKKEELILNFDPTVF